MAVQLTMILIVFAENSQKSSLTLLICTLLSAVPKSVLAFAWMFELTAELTLTSPALMLFTLPNDIVKGNGTGRGQGRGQGQGSTGHGRGQGLGKGNGKGEGLSKDQRSAGRGQGQSGRGQRQAAGRGQGPGNISRQVRLLAEVKEFTAVAT
jgi:hypothetical protein